MGSNDLGERPDAERPKDLGGYNVRIAGGEYHEKFAGVFGGSAGRWIVVLEDAETIAAGYPLAWFRLDARDIERVFETWAAYVEWFEQNKPKTEPE